jgi:hypothetical protein
VDKRRGAAYEFVAPVGGLDEVNIQSSLRQELALSVNCRSTINLTLSDFHIFLTSLRITCIALYVLLLPSIVPSYLVTEQDETSQIQN